MKTLIILAGIGQLSLVIGSLAIPRMLKWSEELSKVSPLIRQIFWTYAGYILCTNLSFGLVSVFASQLLLDGSPLAVAITAFISIYWGARIIIQFTYFDRSQVGTGLIFRLGEMALVSLFVYCTIVYGYAAYLNFSGVNR